MKHSPHQNQLNDSLGPTKFSAEGFLGSDSRPLDEIVADDRRALDNAGIDKALLVEALKKAFGAARDALGAEVEIRPGVSAVFHESMGRIPSPFRGDGVFAKGEAVVTEKSTGHRLIVTALGINLIENHALFQGKGSRYRIEPLEAARILDPLGP